MPPLSKRVAAIACADLHFSLKPPIARSCKDWLKVQQGYIDQLCLLAEIHKCPVLCAGDICDKASMPPELISFLLKYLPQMYAIPGNHDLPNHDYQAMHRSVYGVLVQAGKIIDLEPGKPMEITGGSGTPLRLHGFPWGYVPTPLKSNGLMLEIALLHEYIWKKTDSAYPGAPESAHISHLHEKVEGYDVVIIGDNHKSFGSVERAPRIINVGGFMRRKADEKDHKPSVVVIFSDGSTIRHYLDCSRDEFNDVGEVEKLLSGIGVQTFIEALSILGGAAIDFASAVEQIMERDKVSPDVKNNVRTFMGGEK